MLQKVLSDKNIIQVTHVSHMIVCNLNCLAGGIVQWWRTCLAWLRPQAIPAPKNKIIKK